MKTIYKYAINIGPVNLVLMPRDAKLLTVQLQNGEPFIWAEVDNVNDDVFRHIGIFGTGHALITSDVSDPSKVAYVGTFQQDGFVWHVYDLG